MSFDPQALAAAAESAARKAETGVSGTDELRPEAELVDHTAESLDLSTTYMGLDLRNPLVASAGPLSQSVDGIIQLADAGCGAVVMSSLFEEQIRAETRREHLMTVKHEESFAEALTYFPTEPLQENYTRHYLELIEAAAAAIDVPLIASLNGATNGGWTDTARQMVDAGASAIELNVYFVPGDLITSGSEVEARHVEILQEVKSVVDVPVAVKLSPYFSSTGAMCAELDEAGADGLVLFNRFLQPEIDIEQIELKPGFELSSRSEGKLPRTWIAALYGKVNASLAATTGVEDADDVVKYLMAGADVVMSTSALVRNGIGYASTLLDGLETYLRRKQLTLQQLRGMLAVPADADANVYARSGYVAALEKAKTRYGM